MPSSGNPYIAARMASSLPGARIPASPKGKAVCAITTHMNSATPASTPAMSMRITLALAPDQVSTLSLRDAFVNDQLANQLSPNERAKRQAP